ncbi:MAG: hypothetical protein V7L27_18695 [Nostoc sp.]|uniref:hypothetical protein n=1 Tax=Nostoc sp. TaxID=1180 RepID=UPI002FF7A21A
MSSDAMALSGDAMALSGDAMALSGDAMTLSGDAMTLSGDAIALSGDAMTLSDDAMALQQVGLKLHVNTNTKLQKRHFAKKQLSQYLNKPIFLFQKCLLNTKIVELLSNLVIGQLSNYLD